MPFGPPMARVFAPLRAAGFSFLGWALEARSLRTSRHSRHEAFVAEQPSDRSCNMPVKVTESALDALASRSA
jgi:hypothetical protein